MNFTITPQELSFYDDKQGKWIAEPGEFEAIIGNSSTDIKGKVNFELIR